MGMKQKGRYRILEINRSRDVNGNETEASNVVGYRAWTGNQWR